MEHKGIQYTIVQTASPTGWKWTAHFSLRTKTGTSHNRLKAILAAERAIEELVAKKKSMSGTGHKDYD